MHQRQPLVRPLGLLPLPFLLLLATLVSTGCGTATGPHGGAANPDGGARGPDASAPIDAARVMDATGTDATVTDARVADGSDATAPPLDGAGTDGGGKTYGPLRASSTNSRYFVDSRGKAVLLAGSHTWDDSQDISQTNPPPPFDFDAYVAFLLSHGQNVTILWKWDTPVLCALDGANWYVSPWPWVRTTGQGNASDGLGKFDLSMFDQSYFDRLRGQVQKLQQNGIYAIVELFNGENLHAFRCATDGYPFTGGNNVNGIDDGGGTASLAMTAPNAISAYEDAYAEKVIDTLNDLDNVLWEISEEASQDTAAWWSPHMIGLIHAYEGGGAFEGTTYPGKPAQHPVGWPTTLTNDAQLYASAADWIAPSATIAPSDNQGKVIINDSDHSNYYTNFVDTSTGVVDANAVHDFVWDNFMNGASVLFMDPYEFYWSINQRNLCTGAAGGICATFDPKFDDFRDNLGYLVRYAGEVDLLAMTPQGSLASTGYCLAHPAPQAEYLVYAPRGAGFTLTLPAGTFAAQWLDVSTGSTAAGGTVTGGSDVALTPAATDDSVLYLKGQ